MKSYPRSIQLQFLFAVGITILNLGTLFLVAPLQENLSHLGNALSYKWYLILWGVSAALYFFVYTYKLLKKSQYSFTLGKCLFIFSCCCMALSVLLPYSPQVYPELSKWHTRIAMWGTSGYVIFFYHYLSQLMKCDYVLFEKSMIAYSFLVVFDLLLYMLNGGVSTLLEISFTIYMAFLLLWMNVRSGTYHKEM